MATTLPQNPYQTLGVTPDADAAAIKKAYRKLVLSCHPDKVTDESLKAQKQDEFHKIQQAYETIGDPDNRTKYELELKAKKLREERDRTTPRASPAHTNHVNVNIYTARPPPEFRSSSSKHSPSKPNSSKPYSSDFSQSWEHGIPTRSRTYYEENRKTRRTVSDEKLKRDRDDLKEMDRRRRERQREEEREREKQRQFAEDAERQRRKRERELKEKERDRIRREAARREREDREEREAREERDMRAKAERKAKERADRERADRVRRQEAEEKSRPKNRAYVEPYSEEDEDGRKSRSKKSPKKDSLPRDKSASKRSTPRDEVVPDMPTMEKLSSTMAFAANYIKGKSTSKHSVDAPFSSAEYPDPNDWAPKRRGSNDAKHAKAEAVHIVEGDSPRDRAETSPTSRAPPPLKKSYTMGHVPAAEAPPTRIPFGRSHTMEPDFFSRSAGADKHRPSRGRSSFDDDDYPSSRPRVQKYKVGTDKGTPRVFETADYREPYSRGPSASFERIKTSTPWSVDDVSTSRPYSKEELLTSKYGPPSYADYPGAYAAHVSA